MGRIVLLCGVFFVAFTVGLVVGLGLGRSERSGDESAAPGEGSVLDVSSEPVVPALAPSPGELEAVHPAKPAGPGDRSPAELISAVPIPAVERGVGTISGRVRTETGEPLAGVRIRAHRNRENREWRGGRSPAPDEPSLEERVRSMVLEERWDQAHRREARSGDDGTFTLSGLAQAAYSVEGRRDGYEVQSETPRGGHSVRPGQTLEMVGRAILKVPLTILMPDGTKPSRAMVLIEQSSSRFRGGHGHVTWTPERPWVELRPGTHWLSAIQGESDDLSSSLEEVTVETGSPVSPVTLELRDRPGIKGQVHFEDESRLAVVHALRVNPANPPDVARLIGEGQTESVNLDRGPGFAFKDLIPGPYVIGVSRGRRRTALAAEVVEVSDRMVVRDLALPPLQRSEYFVLHVVGPNGEVLTGVEITTSLRLKSGEIGSSSGAEVRRSDGSFIVLHEELDQREGEEAVNTVTVQADNYPPKTVEYRSAEVSEMTIQFTRPASLEATVEGYAPAAHEGKVTVGIVEPEEGDPGFHRGGLGKDLHDGRVSFSPLNPGDYVVVLYYQAGRHGSFPILKVPVTLNPGKNAVKLAMPRLFSLKVFVDGAPRDSSLQVRPAGDGRAGSWGVSQEIGKDGQVFFGGLPAGNYNLSMHGGVDQEEMPVSVPGRSEVRFLARKHDAMRVTIADAEGGLAGAGFRTADLIVGVNGAGFETAAEFWNLLDQAPPEEELRFQVQRGGDLIEIPLNQERFREGGSVEPTSR